MTQYEALFELEADGLPAPVEETGVIVAAPPIESAPTEYISQEDRAMAAIFTEPIAVTVRARALSQALSGLGVANHDRGFARASMLPEHRPRMVAAYGDQLDAMTDNALYSAEDAVRDARVAFFAASGVGRLAMATAHTPLTGNERVVRRVLDGMWQQFRKQYGVSGKVGRDKRRDFQASLDRVLTAAEEDVA